MITSIASEDRSFTSDLNKFGREPVFHMSSLRKEEVAGAFGLYRAAGVTVLMLGVTTLWVSQCSVGLAFHLGT